MAYGDSPPPGSPIPANADLVFEIEIVDIMDAARYEEGMAIHEQAFQASRGGPLGPPTQ
jgi:FKBP-type peptidyl-prolyl cis-trans isomerase FkpA